jgi:hypothetical protein
VPTNFNLSAPISGIPNIASIRAWLFAAPVSYPSSGSVPFNPTTAEVAAPSAHFIVFEGFNGLNQTGASQGRGRLDTGQVSVQQYYKVSGQSALEDALINAFGGG